MTIHSWPLQISAISVASYLHVHTCFIAKVFLHGLNFSNCILGCLHGLNFSIVFLAASDISSLSYQLLFTSAELFFFLFFYIGFQVLVVSWVRLFYSEGVFGVVVSTRRAEVAFLWRGFQHEVHVPSGARR